jgi:flagella basal body P-ring formation protein FlgA
MRIQALSMMLLALWAGAARPAAAAACVAGQPTLDDACVAVAVEAALRERWAADGARLDVRVERLSRPVSVPPGPLEIEAQLAQGLPPRSRVPLRVRVASGGRPVASVVVWAQVHLWKTVLRSRSALARDTVLAPSMLEPVEMDVAALGAQPYAESPGRSRLRVAMPAGMVLLQRHVTTLALVARDDRVRLRYRYGDIDLDTVAVATGDGALGSVVGVRKPGSGETLQAVVTGPGTVAPRP